MSALFSGLFLKNSWSKSVIKVTRERFLVKLGTAEHIDVTFNVRNCGDAALHNVILEVAADDFFCKAVTPGVGTVEEPLAPYSGFAKITIRIPILAPKHRRSEQVPSTLNVTIKANLLPSNKQQTLSLDSFELFFQEFNDSFQDLVPERIIRRQGYETVGKPNILVFGWIGAGKTSFLNDTLTLLDPSERQEVNTNGGGYVSHGANHGTTELVMNSLVTGSGKDYKLNIWDTWGLTSGNYQSDELAKICRGFLPEKGWGHKFIHRAHDKTIDAIASTRPQREIQAVILIIPAAIVKLPEEVDKMRDQLRHFSEAKLNPMIVVSQLDVQIPGLREAYTSRDPRGIAALQTKVNAYLDETHRVLGQAPNRIFWKLNYTMEKTRKFEIDRQTYRVWEMALKVAKEVIERETREIDGVGLAPPIPVPSTLVAGRYQPPTLTESGVTGGGGVGGDVSDAHATTDPQLGAPEYKEGVCFVCKSRPATQVLEPCGHWCLCDGDAHDFHPEEVIEKCPVCETVITGFA